MVLAVDKQDKLDVFPAFFKVDEKKIVIFGGAEEAFAKVRLLQNTNAVCVVYAESFSANFSGYLLQNAITFERTLFEPELLNGAVLVFAATGDDEHDRSIVRHAREARIPANAVDLPAFCDFFTPALVNRAPVAVAIGTQGSGPVSSQQIRAKIDQLLSPNLGTLARLAIEYRPIIGRLNFSAPNRRRFWHGFFNGVVSKHVDNQNISKAKQAATLLLNKPQRDFCHVDFVYGGSNSSDLLTLRAQRKMMSADLLIIDEEVASEIVDMARRDAERIFINRDGTTNYFDENIHTGQHIVRLSAGDTHSSQSVVGEIEFLQKNNISFEVVPSVSIAHFPQNFTHLEPQTASVCELTLQGG